MPKDNRLSRLGVLAPAALSACMDASVMAVPAAGAIVSTVLKELSKAFMLKKWFHGSMSAREAETLMMQRGRSGSYLVRESRARPGDFVLSVRVRGRVSHVVIRKQNNKYEVGSGEQFDDLVTLIEHFRSFPMTESSGDVLRLLQPVSGTCLRVNDLDTKLRKMQELDEKPLLDEKYGFTAEFQTLQALDQLSVLTTNEGLKLENAAKNRYSNILPYDQTRVVLRGAAPEQNGNDYINASFIRPCSLYDSSSSVQSSNESLDSVHSLRLSKEPKKNKPLVSKSLSDEALREIRHYIQLDKLNGNSYRDHAKSKVYVATQGCLSNTKDDFWRMIVQEDIRIIIMITNEYEKGKKKCERYWPRPEREETYGDVTVRGVTETVHGDYLVRQMTVADPTRGERTVWHYQFTAWPDHGVPESTRGVLRFIAAVNQRGTELMMGSQPPEQNIVCVHCSAGVGRTGTFIVLDMLIDKIKMSGFQCDIDVHNTVKLVRAQRGRMVQNKTQYKFIYLALQDYIVHEGRQITNKVYCMEA